jgi:hypothetical protein
MRIGWMLIVRPWPGVRTHISASGQAAQVAASNTASVEWPGRKWKRATLLARADDRARLQVDLVCRPVEKVHRIRSNRYRVPGESVHLPREGGGQPGPAGTGGVMEMTSGALERRSSSQVASF